MPFDYGFRFAGHARHRAAICRLGPVEDLNISVYDRADGAPLRIDFDINPALHTAADLEVLSAEISEAVGSNRRCRSPDRQSFHSGSGRARHHPAGLERHGAGALVADVSRTVRRAGRAHAGRGGGDVRGPHADLRGARRPRQPAGASSAKPGRRARDRGGAVRRALARDGDRASRHPQGRRRLPADRCRLSARTFGVHAGRCRRVGAGDAVGAGGSDAGCRERAASFGSMPTRRRSRGSPTPRRRSTSIRVTRPMSSTPRARPERRRPSSSSTRA